MKNIDNISFDHCLKCTVCTVYCPVARATHLFPGPKQSGPDTERLRIKDPFLVDVSLKYCSNCKRCEIACPSDVKIADIIQRARMQYLGKELRARDFILSRTDLMGSIATRASRFLNFFLRLFPVKFLLDHFFSISGKATLPEYKPETFKAWYKKNRSTQKNFKEKVVYFHGCYVNYNNNDLGKAVINLINAMEIGVVTVDEKCCGVPLIANSYLDKAKKNARFNIDILGKAVKDTNMKIVSASSSCMLALKHEYPGILALDTKPIAPHLEYITEFIHKRFELKGVPIMSPLGLKAVYHAPCHLERMGGVIYTIGVLKMIPGLRLTVLHSECCGISGTYGFKKECSQICEDVGADLFSRLESLNPDIVVSDCETCKWQIEMNTKYKVAHPVELLAMAIEA